MKGIRFDFNNLFSENVGEAHGITEADLNNIIPALKKAHEHLSKVLKDERNRINLSLEWARLPFQKSEDIALIQKLGKQIALKYESVLFLGIGGSYLGLKAAQDALLPPYYNEFSALRKSHPKIYFDGFNLDPDTLSVLLKNLNPKKTCVIVISKSGETTETKAAFMMAEAWLKKAIGKNYGRSIIAITDPSSGSLRKKVNEENSKDSLSFRSLNLLKGVGGRFSEFNMGLLHLAICGEKIQEVLNGAKAMMEECSKEELFKNPAYLYATLHYMLYKNKHKPISVMMPFSETLKSTADWYVQLLAESLGKKYARIIKTGADGLETWESDKNAVVNVGRTPIPCRGTNDLHSIQQNNIEGENDKVVTFIRVEKFRHEIKLPGKDLISGQSFSKLLLLAQEATEWALVREGRPNCAISLSEVSAFNWGALLIFFEMATAFEGELLNINAFDQPGVEGYKNYMYFKLNKPNLSESIVRQIKDNPLKKLDKYIV